jgi:hypothetical protein
MVFRVVREQTLTVIGILVSIMIFVMGSLIQGQVSLTSGVLGMFSLLISFYINIRLNISDIVSELRSRRAFERIPKKFVREIALNELTKRDSIFDHIAQGRIYLDSIGSMMQVYYELLRDTDVKKLRATSMVSMNMVWESERGRKTLHDNLKAVERGVSIERIFIFPDEATRDDTEARVHLKKQVDGGISVRTVLARNIETANRRDFGITDSGVLLEYSIGPDGDIVKCMISANEQDIERYNQIYEQIKSESSELKP